MQKAFPAQVSIEIRFGNAISPKFEFFPSPGPPKSEFRTSYTAVASLRFSIDLSQFTDFKLISMNKALFESVRQEQGPPKPHETTFDYLQRRYRYEDVHTPYEKLKSLPDAEQYLKAGVTFAKLDAFATRYSDNEAADRLREARKKLFYSIDELQRTQA